MVDDSAQAAQTARMGKARAVPVLIDAGNIRTSLERIHLGQGIHNEKWLQELIHAHPSILPVSEIEPGFGELIAAAREVPCGHGFIDNLYLTPAGEIVVVETKLWRNTQMRREVVAQALDYVAALTGMSFDAFQTAVAKGVGGPRKLYDLVADDQESLVESDFIDAVSFNLQRGRFLVIALGDGIRSETQALGELLQSHAGAHFTFALVELATWKNALTGDILAIPSTLAKTLMIERGIVRLEQGQMTVEPMPVGAKNEPQSISMTEFWDALATKNTQLPDAIRAFLDALKPYGVYSDLKAALTLRAEAPEWEKTLSFGYIARNGQFWPHLPSWVPEHIWKPYFEAVAAMLGGVVIDKPGARHVVVNGRAAPDINHLLPAHHDALVSAIGQVLRQLSVEPL